MKSLTKSSTEKSATPGITVRLSPAVRERLMKLARSEHRSTAAYIEHLVERDLHERDEAERIVRVHVAAGLPEASTGQVSQEDGESAERHQRRTDVLNTLFGNR